jgi:hypothetical protein
MTVLLALFNRLFAALQKPSLFGLNGLILHPNHTQNRAPNPSCGARCGAAVPPSSVLILPSFFDVGVWGGATLNLA